MNKHRSRGLKSFKGINLLSHIMNFASRRLLELLQLFLHFNCSGNRLLVIIICQVR